MAGGRVAGARAPGRVGRQKSMSDPSSSVVGVKKRYSYRAYPTPGQAQALARLFGCVRVVFNDSVAAQRAARERGDKPLSGAALQSLVVAQAKHTDERAWLSEVSTVPLEQSVRDADKALRSFFDSVSGRRKGRRVNPSRFKSRRAKQSARFTRNGFSRVRETTHGVGFVRLAKIGDVRFVLSRTLPSEPSSVTIARESDGSYWLSFVVDVNVNVEPAAPTHPGRAAALDVGLTDFAAVVYSDGTREKIANPRHLRAAAKRLAKKQRALARASKGSARRERARLAVAREHRRVRQARLDFHHQLSTRLTRENQAVVVEKLSVVGLARSSARGSKGRGVRRAWADAGMGQFLALLASKAQEHGRDFAPVDPFWTSQTCAVCGVHDGPKPLNVRVWDCAACGAHLDRDWNAAVNIMLAAGLAESLNGRGGDIRLSLAAADPDETSTRRTASADALAA